MSCRIAALLAFVVALTLIACGDAFGGGVDLDAGSGGAGSRNASAGEHAGGGTSTGGAASGGTSTGGTSTGGDSAAGSTSGEAGAPANCTIPRGCCGDYSDTDICSHWLISDMREGACCPRCKCEGPGEAECLALAECVGRNACGTEEDRGCCAGTCAAECQAAKTAGAFDRGIWLATCICNRPADHC